MRNNGNHYIGKVAGQGAAAKTPAQPHLHFPGVTADAAVPGSAQRQLQGSIAETAAQPYHTFTQQRSNH